MISPWLLHPGWRWMPNVLISSETWSEWRTFLGQPHPTECLGICVLYTVQKQNKTVQSQGQWRSISTGLSPDRHKGWPPHPSQRSGGCSTITEEREVGWSRQFPSRTDPNRWRRCNHRSHNNLRSDLADWEMANIVDPVLSHHTSQKGYLLTYLVLWAQSTSKDYISSENKLHSISKLVISQVMIPQVIFFWAYLYSAGIQHGNLHPARWPILFCGPTQKPVLAAANTWKT